VRVVLAAVSDEDKQCTMLLVFKVKKQVSVETMISRRDFLKDAFLAVAAAGMVHPAAELGSRSERRAGGSG
jgi:hypothetical protein